MGWHKDEMLAFVFAVTTMGHPWRGARRASPARPRREASGGRRVWGHRRRTWRVSSVVRGYRLRGHVPQGQQINRRLLAGPLTCTPTDSRQYRLSGAATVTKLVEGPVSLIVVSPAFVSWNHLERFLRAVDGLRLAA